MERLLSYTFLPPLITHYICWTISWVDLRLRLLFEYGSHQKWLMTWLPMQCQLNSIWFDRPLKRSKPDKDWMAEFKCLLWLKHSHNNLNSPEREVHWTIRIAFMFANDLAFLLLKCLKLKIWDSLRTKNILNKKSMYCDLWCFVYISSK